MSDTRLQDDWLIDWLSPGSGGDTFLCDSWQNNSSERVTSIIVFLVIGFKVKSILNPQKLHISFYMESWADYKHSIISSIQCRSTLSMLNYLLNVDVCLSISFFSFFFFPFLFSFIFVSVGYWLWKQQLTGVNLSSIRIQHSPGVPLAWIIQLLLHSTDITLFIFPADTYHP